METSHQSQELSTAIDDLISNNNTMQVFDLNSHEISELMRVKVTDTGFDVSPNFQSLGWGENESDVLAINLSDLGNGRGVLEHELKHALHCLVCASLFRGNDALENFHQFVDVVIKDPGFYEWRMSSTNPSAEQQWLYIEEMMRNSDLTVNEIQNNAVLLGSVVYQHAYFVDPTICEAVASTNDKGFVGLSGIINRIVGRALPGDQFLEGYGWKEAQEAFGRSEKKKKAFFIKKADYKRREYFDF